MEEWNPVSCHHLGGTEVIMVREVSEAQENKHHLFSLVGAKRVDLMKIESRLVVTRGQEVGSRTCRG